MMLDEKVVIIVPAHNEGRTLAANVRKLKRVLGGVFSDFGIIISEDGSTDSTADIAKSLESHNVRALHQEKRLGKGAAIKAAIRHAQANIVIFMDADLASHPKHTEELVRALDEGASIVVGSRYHERSRVRRAIMRDAASRTFNWLVRALLGSRIKDHQCGFKAFRKDMVLPIIEEIEDREWFWDTELLVRAQRKGLKVAEIPIEWEEAPDSRFRLLEDTCHMAASLVSFKIRNG